MKKWRKQSHKGNMAGKSLRNISIDDGTQALKVWFTWLKSKNCSYCQILLQIFLFLIFFWLPTQCFSHYTIVHLLSHTLIKLTVIECVIVQSSKIQTKVPILKKKWQSTIRSGWLPFILSAASVFTGIDYKEITFVLGYF